MSGIPTCRISLLAALTLALVSPLAVGQTATTGTSTPVTGVTSSPTSQPATATTSESKLVAQFTDLAGSKENATSLVQGLRTGSAINLTSGTSTSTSGTTATGSSTTTTSATGGSTSFTSPTKPMGYGNIRIALSLAQTQLASQGVTNPTPSQLQGALVGSSGGTGTQSGILQMRADGMGWGKIANSMGVKLGAVMSGKQTWPTAGSTTGNTTHGSSGITTAAGSSGRSSGVTTAAGGSTHGGTITTGLGSTSSAGMAYGHTTHGTVNAAGGQAGSMAGAGGHGNGVGKR